MSHATADFAVPPVTLIGHPNMANGRGEHIRAVWRAFRAAGVTARIYNLYRQSTPNSTPFVPHTIEFYSRKDC